MELNNSNMKKLIKLIIITVLVVFCVFRFDKIYACGTWIIGLLMPFVIGFAIAFILNVPMKGFENLLFRNEKSRWYRFRRPVCMVLSLICVVLVIAFVITMLIPEVSRTITAIGQQFPSTMEAIKNYRPSSNSVGSGQVLQCPYSYEKAGLIVREMTELLVLDLVDKGLVTNQIVLTVGYDIENLKQSEFQKNYRGEIKTDRYGRKIPKHAHGTMNLEEYTSSTRRIVDATVELYQRIVDPKLLVRRISLVANHVIQECEIAETDSYEQMDLFTDYQAKEEQKQREKEERERERSMQQAVLELKKKFGKNAVLKGMNLQEGATTIERNRQIGGHKA